VEKNQGDASAVRPSEAGLIQAGVEAASQLPSLSDSVFLAGVAPDSVASPIAGIAVVLSLHPTEAEAIIKYPPDRTISCGFPSSGFRGKRTEI
jgi:hypothetical protein